MLDGIGPALCGIGISVLGGKIPPNPRVRRRGTEAIVKTSLRIIGYLACMALGAAGVASLVVSSRVVEGNDGFYFFIASRRVALPDSGMLGDFGTYQADWTMLGLFCLAAASLVAVFPRARHRFARGVTIGALVLALAAVAMYAQLVLL